MNIDKARAAEHEKYTRCYTQGNYRMGFVRMKPAVDALKKLPCRGKYLDVGCGRGEMLNFALYLGFSNVHGTEIVPELTDGDRVVRAEVHSLPFDRGSFDVVTMFDVIEHLLPGDDELACRQLAKVARRHILITANNKASRNRAGDVLHINRREYAEWDSLFRQWFAGKVTQIGDPSHFSQMWQIDYQ